MKFAPILRMGNILWAKGGVPVKAAIIGGDERFRYAAKWLNKMGHEARWMGKFPEGYIETALVQREEDIVGDNFGVCFVQRGIGTREKTVYLENIEDYLLKNAFLTAEGALKAVMGAEGHALFGANCLVIGYGRIGRALTGMLRAMKAQVTVAVRPGKSMDRAETDGVPFLNMREMQDFVGKFDYIWNTVPERVFSEKALSDISKDAGLFDLASAPFGFDIEEARSKDIWAERLSGLPGKYCPDTAGRVIAQTMESVRKEVSI